MSLVHDVGCVTVEMAGTKIRLDKTRYYSMIEDGQLVHDLEHDTQAINAILAVTGCLHMIEACMPLCFASKSMAVTHLLS